MEIPTNTEYLMYSSSRNKRSVRWFIFSNLIKCFSWVKILYLYLVLHFDLNFLRLLKMIGLFLDISSSFRAMYFLSSSILRSLILFCSAVFILLSPVFKLNFIDSESGENGEMEEIGHLPLRCFL